MIPKYRMVNTIKRCRNYKRHKKLWMSALKRRARLCCIYREQFTVFSIVVAIVDCICALRLKLNMYPQINSLIPVIGGISIWKKMKPDLNRKRREKRKNPPQCFKRRRRYLSISISIESIDRHFALKMYDRKKITTITFDSLEKGCIHHFFIKATT